MNTYYMLQWVRDQLGESTAVHWPDLMILRELNKAQKKYAMLLMMEPGDWMMVKEDITAVNSLVTLPARCAKPAYVEDSNGYDIPIVNTVRERNLTKYPTNGFDNAAFLNAYLRGNYLVINQASYAETITLWYYQRVADLSTGTGGSASGASALELDDDMTPKILDDYYNGITVEIVDGTGAGIVSTITDYASATLVATITGTAGSDSVYGTVTTLPEEAHDLLVLEATVGCLAKPSSALDPKYFQFYSAQLKDSRKIFDEFISDRFAGSNRIRLSN